MAKSNKRPSRETTKQFIVKMVVSLIVLAVADSRIDVFLHKQFDDEIFELFVIVILITAHAASVHFIVHAVWRMDEVVKRAKKSHSGGCHFCNADPNHCFKIRKKPLPICARHLGYYGTLIALGVTAPHLVNNWISFIQLVPWEWHFTAFIASLLIVVIEGGLGKAKVIRVSNIVRLSNGAVSAMGLLFFVTLVFSAFGLLQIVTNR